MKSVSIVDRLLKNMGNMPVQVKDTVIKKLDR